VFDEIDTGISGRISRKVGEAIKVLAHSHQVLVITHQAIVASMAQQHILVHKHVEGGRTRVHAESIAGDQRITEIAALLGGDGSSASARLQAMELLAGNQDDTTVGSEEHTRRTTTRTSKKKV
jgi:DNA repair protein RecN (Recombination protein N)